MKNVSAKPETLRSATAAATLHAPPDCVVLLRERRAEKGDALEIGRMAAMLAAKKTWELLPLCHQLPLTAIEVGYELREAAIEIRVRVETIAGTGVEMEALTAASVCALTIYDLLKPHADQSTLHIGGVHLVEKTGGKSQYARALSPPGRAVLLATSDAVVSGRKHATAAQTVREGLERAGIRVEVTETLPDEPTQIEQRLRHWLSQGVELIATVGGTGIHGRDQTVHAVRPLLDKELPGFMEAARGYGQRRTPYALLSSGIAGIAGQTLVITFPGSTRGAQETLTALISGIVHALEGLRRTS
ncbi:MAG TPA: bifunctional molybdenum cofactor biosynthesis protein MoaC/MoaB [Stenotrophobium sp.]|jgi:molybdenum cofactor biosynthesis protein MoaC|nr:bifunctional molybdenum cofactor biosynthesis protein MoaC/MoaB [Stenotrophobium sp.]